MDDYAKIDESEPSIVKVRVVRPPTDENYRDYLERITHIYRKYERFGVLFDTGNLGHFPSKYRAMQTEWLEQTRNEFEGRLICAAFVIKHRVIRGALAAMFWLNPPYFVPKVFVDREEALSWIREQLQL